MIAGFWQDLFSLANWYKYVFSPNDIIINAACALPSELVTRLETVSGSI